MSTNYAEFSRVLSRVQKDFQRWQIPWKDMQRLNLRSKMPLKGYLRCGDLESRFGSKTDSDGKFRLPQELVDGISSIAQADPTMEIWFRIDFKAVDVEAASFETVVRQRLQDSEENRLRRLEKAPTIPESKIVQTVVYYRNPDVVAQRLHMANGRCEECGANAPFLRESDGTPYLEVHHLTRLSEGGADTVVNTIAVCPNCHRRYHFGRSID